LLKWKGKYLIQQIIDSLRTQFKEILVVTNKPKLYASILDVVVLEDKIKGGGPMGGIYTGLMAAKNYYSLVAACDMPLIDLKIISLLLSEIEGSTAMAIVPKLAENWEPLLAIYSKACIPKLEESLTQGRARMQEFLDLISAKAVPEEKLRELDPALRCFTNLNTLEDLERLGMELEA